MRKMIKLMCVCAVGAMVMSPPAAVEAMMRKGPKPAVVKPPKKPSNFKAIKGKMKQLKGRGKTAYRNLKAAHRSESFNRQRKQQFEARYIAANDRYIANSTRANFQLAQQRYQEYLGAKQNHDSALNTWNAAKRQVNAVWGDTLLEPNRMRAQRALPAPRAPRTGSPRINQQARVRNTRSGAAVVPNARAMLRPGGQMARRNVASAVQNPQPVGNPANFPRAAMAQQRAQNLNSQLRQWERTQLNQFNQQQAAVQPAQQRQQAANNDYIRPPAPARLSQTHLYGPAPGGTQRLQRPIVQNQYNVVTQPMAAQNNRIITGQGQGVQQTQPGQNQQLPTRPLPNTPYEAPSDGIQ